MTSKVVKSRTIRELGGEIWSEVSSAIPEEEADWKVKNKIVEIMMAVLARYEGAVIENDADLPVEPLPRKKPEEPVQ
jgi:hypothetical protein